VQVPLLGGSLGHAGVSQHWRGGCVCLGVPHSGAAQPGCAGGNRCPMSLVLLLSEGFGVLLGGWSPLMGFGVPWWGLGSPLGLGSLGFGG